MSRLPPRPDLEWKDDGTPVSRAFNDVYFSLSDGLEETRSVFLKACGLPERWETAPRFTVAELGFGSGLNFLGLLACWKDSPKPDAAWLHFTSVEKFLMSADDARRVLSRWADLAELSKLLLARWPIRTKGVQRIEFPELRATLTIYIGDAEDWLSTCEFAANAWFLDGFAPAKNDSMWGDAIYQLMAQRSAPGALVGTYTVAGHVRRGLAEVGFQVSKQPGFGRKRERLEAIWPDDANTPSRPDLSLACPDKVSFEKIVIVGAGIAGACAARAYAERGFSVKLIDQASGPASGASGNPIGLVMPRLDAADTPQARLLIQTYLRARRFYEDRCPGELHHLDVRQTPQNDKEQIRFDKLMADPPLDEGWLSSGPEGLVHSGAVMVKPAELVARLIDHSNIELCWNSRLDELEEVSQPASLVIIATGWQSPDLLGQDVTPLTGKMGQVNWGARQTEASEPAAKASGSYILSLDETILFGATFEKIDAGETPDVSDAATAENIAAAQTLAPDWLAGLDLGALQARASVRGTTPDRMPIAGVCFEAERVRSVLQPLSKGADVSECLPHTPTVYALCGMGARGFTFAPLLAELIVAQSLGEPLPLARPEIEQVTPVRFLVRAVRKGTALSSES